VHLWGPVTRCARRGTLWLLSRREIWAPTPSENTQLLRNYENRWSVIHQVAVLVSNSACYQMTLILVSIFISMFIKVVTAWFHAHLLSLIFRVYCKLKKVKSHVLNRNMQKYRKLLKTWSKLAFFSVDVKFECVFRCTCFMARRAGRARCLILWICYHLMMQTCLLQHRSHRRWRNGPLPDRSHDGRRTVVTSLRILPSTRAKQASTWFIYIGWMEGRVELGGWLCTEVVYLSVDTYL